MRMPACDQASTSRGQSRALDKFVLLQAMHGTEAAALAKRSTHVFKRVAAGDPALTAMTQL
jgi:hypothetical protein